MRIATAFFCCKVVRVASLKRYMQHICAFIVYLFVLTECVVRCEEKGIDAAADSPMVLLVHGMKFDLSSESNVWGQCAAESPIGIGTGIIGCLEQSGLPFGGIIRTQEGVPNISLHSNVPTGASTARVYCLEFSRAANVDGLAFKAIELAACVRELKRISGKRVCIVAHSAGGLATRAWLQRALPGVTYDDEVDRVVMISTPHLGSGKAQHWGDFLGTRATSLQPGSDLIRQINEQLPLPSSVKFASIVVRGVAVGVTGLHDQESAITPFVRNVDLEKWPLDFLKGTDQVLDVRTQNLRLAKCSDEYEARSNLPIVTLLARVPDPSPADASLRDLTVHETAPRNDSVVDLVKLLITGPECDSPWNARATCNHQWHDRQLRLHAAGIAEDVVAQRHALSEVRDTILEEWSVDVTDPGEVELHFSCRSTSRNRALGFNNRPMIVRGNATVKLDRFGRTTILGTKIIEAKSD